VDLADATAASTFRNSVWSFIEKANAIAPSHSRIFKEMILIAFHEKPFQYTPKGSVSRHRTLALYESEIEAKYGAIQEASTSNVKTPVSWTEPNASSYVRAVVLEIMRPNGPDLNDDDLFIQGCDSLQASVIRNRLHRTLRETMKRPLPLPSNWVYTNPTIPLLSTSFYNVVTTGSFASGSSSKVSCVEMLEGMALKYASNFPKHTGSTALPPHHTVLLSGATGTLGCYILNALVKDPKVSLVYAVNRPSLSGSGLERQTRAFRNRGLDTSILHNGRVVLVDADLSKPDFAMSDKDLLKKMQNSVTCIVHNAWRLNFNLGINSFVPNIESTRYLVDFALGSPYGEPASILFTSSISTIAAHPTGQVQEVCGDPLWVAPIGYAQSKFVAEKILEAAPLKTCSIRVGQLSGSRVNGAWNVTDWFPMMVKAGQVMGCLPLRHDEVAWLPTDVVAQVIVELANTESLPAIAHAVHPRTVGWSEVIRPVAESIGAQIVPYDKWIAELEKEVDMTKNPAIKLLAYYKGRAPVEGAERGVIETERTTLLSPALATLSKLSSGDSERWIGYWRELGFLKRV
jgi:thioester reductase-like protein